MKKNTDILEILKNFWEGIDYTTDEKNKEAVSYTIYNKELRQLLVNQWQNEGFFQDFLKISPALENNKKDDFRKKDNCDEEISCGWREEIPVGKEKGEVKQFFYHWKIEEKEKSQTKNTFASDKKKTNQQNLSQKLENKNNSSKNVYFGVGMIFLALVAVSMMIVWVKRRKELK